MNRLLRFAPIIYFILLTGLWFLQDNIETGTYNYTCIALFVALVAQLFTNNKTSGFLYGILYLVFSGYMIITAITSHMETELVTENTLPFYLKMYAFYGFSFLMAVVMIYYHRYYLPKAAN